MSRYSDTITTPVGTPIEGVSVYVFDSETEALATLTDDGGGALANPVLSDEYGGFYFNAPAGFYTLEYHFGGRTLLRRENVSVGGASDAFRTIAEEVVNTTVLTVTSATGQAVATRGILAGISSPVAGQLAFLTESGRDGEFVFDSSDRSAQVALDSYQGIYVAPASDADGSSGAWVRRYHGAVNLNWFGVGSAAVDNAARIESGIDLLDGGTRFLLPRGLVPLERELRIKRAVMLEGHGNGISLNVGLSGGTTLTHGAGYSGIRFPYTPGSEDVYDSYFGNLKIFQTARLATTATGNFTTSNRTLTITGGTNDYQNGQLVRVNGAGLSQTIPGKTAAVASGSNLVTMTNNFDCGGNSAVHVGLPIDIAGAGLPAGTVVTEVLSSTQFRISNNAASTVSGAAYTVKWPLIATILSGAGTANLVLDVYSEFQDATGVAVSHADANIVLERNINMEHITCSGAAINSPVAVNLFVHASSTAGGGDVANTFTARVCRFYSADIGTYVSGFDANASSFEACDWSLYNQIGAFDNGLIGNFYSGHFAYNTGLVCAVPNSFVRLTNSYVELGTSMIGNSTGAYQSANQYVTSGMGFTGDEATGNGYRTNGINALNVDARDAFYVDGEKVVSNRGAAIADPAGGSVVDVEARNAIAQILGRLRAATGHGLIS